MNMESKPPIEWYECDNDLILGFCGYRGDQGVYCYWLNRSDKWQFCPAETKAWDFYHQKVYLQGRADRIEFGTLVGRVPSLPAQFPPPEKYHVTDPPEPYTPNVLPESKIFEKVKYAPTRRVPVYVVLREDMYESMVGNGIFRYFESAFFEQTAAESYIKTLESKGGYSYHIREVYLTISGNVVALVTKGCDLSPFDHFTRQQICDELAKRITI
jgi:hypothetical protein